MGATICHDNHEMFHAMAKRGALDVQIRVLKADRQAAGKPRKDFFRLLSGFLLASFYLEKYLHGFPLTKCIETCGDLECIRDIYDTEKGTLEKLSKLCEKLDGIPETSWLRRWVFDRMKRKFNRYADELDKRVEEMDWILDKEANKALDCLTATVDRVSSRLPSWRDSMDFLQ